MARCCSSPPPLSIDTEPSSGSKTPLNSLPIRVSRATPRLGSDPPHARHSMTFGATLSVEHRPQALCDGLHGLELGQSGVEICPLCGGQTQQWSGQILCTCRHERLRVGPPLRKQQDENACCRYKHEHRLPHSELERLHSYPLFSPSTSCASSFPPGFVRAAQGFCITKLS